MCLFFTIENLEAIEKGTAGLPSERTSSPIRQEPLTPVKSQNTVGTQQSIRHPIKQEPHTPTKIHHIGSQQYIRGTTIKQEQLTPVKSHSMVGTQQMIRGTLVKQEPVGLTEMDCSSEVTRFDTSLTDQILSIQVRFNKLKQLTFIQRIEIKLYCLPIFFITSVSIFLVTQLKNHVFIDTGKQISCCCLGYLPYWDIYRIGIFTVLGYLPYWDIYRIGIFTVLGYLPYWDIYRIGILTVLGYLP